MRLAALVLLVGAIASCAPASAPPRPSARATPDPSLAGDTPGCLRTFLVLPAARCLDH